MNKLRYRRQFIMGKDISGFNDWNKIVINSNFILATHPDLEVKYIESDDTKLILLGFIIDPFNPQNDDYDNLKELISESLSFKDVLEKTYSYSGRWILIYNSPTEMNIVNDPCGMRQVYYSVKDGHIWCGSQPTILADTLGYDIDNNTDILEYINSEYYEKEERPWFGDKTIFSEIKHLMPNHYLDLFKKGIERFWIDEENNINLETVVKSASEILKGSLISINNRYKIMLPVTAGWDSRVLLAASRDIKENIFYYVSTMNILDENHMDIKIPKRLLNKLGLELNILDNLPPLRDEFKNMLQKNVLMARSLPKTLTIQYHYDYLSDKVNINGNASEIARCFYGIANNKDVDSSYLARIVRCPSNLKFVISEFHKWLNEVRDFSRNNKIELLDLFYWEQRMGNWGTLYQAEQDIAIEEFCPYNNRKLLMMLLKIDKLYRKEPDNKLYELLIKNLWEDTLSEPINPPGLKKIIKNIILKLIPSSIKVKIKKLY